ncbi:MAG: hypothetical protein WC028_32305 [Candidatus Obscuribacterales bacterium]
MPYRIRNFALALAFASVYFIQPSMVCHAAPDSKSKSSNNTSATNSIKSAIKTKRKISAEQAVALVKKRSDVKKFLALFPNGKSKKTLGFPVVEAEELDNNWNVHVYEQMPDHTATMNWFEVNSQTGAIKPMN